MRELAMAPLINEESRCLKILQLCELLTKMEEDLL